MPNLVKERSYTQLSTHQLEDDSDVDSFCMVDDSGPVSPTTSNGTPDENTNARFLLLETKLDTLITTLNRDTPNGLVDYLKSKVTQLESQNRQWEIDTKESQRECARLAHSLRETQAELEETKNNLELAEDANVSLRRELCKTKEDVKSQTRMRVNKESEARIWERRCMKVMHENSTLVLGKSFPLSFFFEVKLTPHRLGSSAGLDQVRLELNMEKANNDSLRMQLNKRQKDAEAETHFQTDRAIRFKCAMFKMKKEKDDLISKLAAELAQVKAELNVEKAKNASCQTELTSELEREEKHDSGVVETHNDQLATTPEPERAKVELSEAMEKELVELKVKVLDSIQTGRQLPLDEAMAALKLASSLMEASNLKKECAEVRDRFFAPREGTRVEW